MSPFWSRGSIGEEGKQLNAETLGSFLFDQVKQLQVARGIRRLPLETAKSHSKESTLKMRATGKGGRGGTPVCRRRANPGMALGTGSRDGRRYILSCMQESAKEL